MSRINSATWDRAVRDFRGAGGARGLARPVMAWLATVVVAAGVAIAAVGNRKIGLALAGLVLVFGIFIADPLLLVVIALPGSLLIQRVGGSSTNLSAADLLVFVGAVVSLFHIRWKEAPYLRQFMRAIVWYQAILILVVVAHPNRYDIVEWFHRFSYLGGSVLVGWTIARYGRSRQAFRLFLWASSIVALIAIERALASHFLPAQWGAYQKNSIGAVLWVAIVVAQVNPPWAGLGRLESRVAKYVCFAGLLASQSRQAVVALILAVSLATFLNPDVRRRSKLVFLGCLPLVAGLYYSFSVAARNNPKFNSVSVRVDQISAAIHVWHLSPILGEGMRFYNLPQFITVTAPPNVLIDNLASTGIVGSLMFFFLVIVTVRALYKLPYVFGTLGLVILVGHYIDGLFDIFWIGASSIAPFILAGISLGIADRDHRANDSAARRGHDLSTEPAAGPRVASPPARTGSREPGGARSPGAPRRTARAATMGVAGALTRRLPAR
jgi:polysaccharide biosynthesis protein PslJ